MVKKILTSVPDKTQDDLIKYNFYIAIINILRIMGSRYYGSGYENTETEKNLVNPNYNGASRNTKQVLRQGQRSAV